jgi:hypothetical protein
MPLSFRFPHQNPVHTSPLPICATCPTHLILLDFIARTKLGKEYRSFSSSLCNTQHKFYMHMNHTVFIFRQNLIMHEIIIYIHCQLRYWIDIPGQ